LNLLRAFRYVFIYAPRLNGCRLGSSQPLYLLLGESQKGAVSR
jgi:hypothetical protein